MQAGALTSVLGCQSVSTPESAPAGGHQQKAEGCSHAHLGARSLHSSASTQLRVTSLQNLCTQLQQNLSFRLQQLPGPGK